MIYPASLKSLLFAAFFPKDWRDILSVKDHIVVNAFWISGLCLCLPVVWMLRNYTKYVSFKMVFNIPEIIFQRIILLQYNISDRHTLLNNNLMDLAFETGNIDDQSLRCLYFL